MSIPQPPQPPQYQPPYGQVPPPPAPQKAPAWIWILVAVGVLFVLGIAAAGIGSYFFISRGLKNAGLDSSLMKTNPGLALAKMAAAMNPDFEAVSTNDGAGTITVREKSTGKTMTLRFDPEKKSLVMVGDDGKEVKITAKGDDKSGSLDIQTPDGNMKFGAAAGNSAPAWVPVYPGASTQGTMSSQTPEGSQNTFTFKTSDSAEKVQSYFQDRLKSAGFTVNVVGATANGFVLQADDAGKKRNIVVTAGSPGEGTEGSVTSIEKK
jgi:hypothetical protein